MILKNSKNSSQEKNRSLKVLLVTSEITYVPQNYAKLFTALFKELNFHAEVNIEGLVLLRNLDLSLLKSTLGLILFGCFGIARIILVNILMMFISKILLLKGQRESIAEHFYIPIYFWQDINDDSKIQWIRKNNIDIIVNLRTRSLYKKELLKAPKLGCLNIHHGILPTFRGTMCDLYALSSGLDAGFTIHKMNEKIDDGEIFHVEIVAPSNSIKSYPEYLKIGARREGEALAHLLKSIGIKKSFPQGIPNVSNAVIYCKTPKTIDDFQKIKKKGIKL